MTSSKKLPLFLLSVAFGWVVVAYVTFNFIYSKVLKEVVIIDVFCIGVFFLLRVMAGSIAVGVELSHWLLFMTVLLAFFLGFNKSTYCQYDKGCNRRV